MTVSEQNSALLWGCFSRDVWIAVVRYLQSHETLEDGTVWTCKICTELTFHLLFLLMFKVLALGLFVLGCKTDKTGNILNMLK